MDIPQSSLLGAASTSSARRPNTATSSGGTPTPASSSPLPSRSTSTKRRRPAAGVETASSGSASHNQAPSSSSAAGSSAALRSSGGRSSRSARERASTGNSSGRKTKDRHSLALESIRHFLKGRSSYDMLPVSFRLIVLDTQLVVGPALDVMWGAGVVSAPLWQSTPTPNTAIDGSQDRNKGSSTTLTDAGIPLEPASAPASTNTSAEAPAESVSLSSMNDSIKKKTSSASRSKPGFAGMLTVNDIIHLIQYYYHHASYDTAKREVETFRLEGLRDIEAALSVPPPPLLSCHPLRPLLEACQLLMKTHARRLPLLDYDEQTGMETVVSVLTQYRILKFIAMNCRETASLQRSIRSLGVGTYVSSYQPKAGSSSRRGSEKIDPLSAVAADPPSAGLTTSPLNSEQGANVPPVPPLPADLVGHGRDPHWGDKMERGPLLRTGSEEQTPKQERTEQHFNLTPFAPEQAESTTDASSATTPATPLSSVPSAPATTTSTSGGGTRTIPTPTAPPSSEANNPYHPIYTATLDTTVFDVVHMFSERGISAVPIVDEDGNVVDMYETVDVITLVRSGAYQDLDLTIRSALTRRPADFPGVYSCSPEDSVANIFALLRRRRVHRLLIVSPEPEEDAMTQHPDRDREAAGEDGSRCGPPRTPAELEDMLEHQGPRIRSRKGKLVGILALSDLLRHIIGIPAAPAGTTAARRRSSDGSSSAFGGEDDPGSSTGGPSAPLMSSVGGGGGTTGSFGVPYVHPTTPASAAPNLLPVPGTGNDATILEGVAVVTPQSTIGQEEEHETGDEGDDAADVEPPRPKFNSYSPPPPYASKDPAFD